MARPDPTTTQLLQASRHGDGDALERLLPRVYDQLASLARRALRGERPDHTLQTRDLIHEAYLRLVAGDVVYEDRSHFLTLAARTMRRVLVDYARARNRLKRHGGVRVDLPDDAARADPPMDVLGLHEALDRLAVFDERKSCIVELHYFGGLSYDETAEALGVSAATVDRELRQAKAWLRQDLTPTS